MRRGPLPPIEKKQRGLIVQILDRFVEARVKRSLREEKGAVAPRSKIGGIRSRVTSLFAFAVSVRFHDHRIDDARSLQFPHNPFVRADNAQVKLPVRRDQYQFLA